MDSSILPQFSTLSDITRVRLLRVLGEEECMVTELISVLKIPQSTISRHLKILLNQGWISKREDKSSNWYRCKKEQLKEPYQSLLKLVQTDQNPIYQQDIRRLQSMIALRKNNCSYFFKENANLWSNIRKELFGDSFLLPTLLSIIPSDLCIVDLGCGNGDALLALGPTGAKLIGIDVTVEMLNIAKERTKHYNNIELREGSLTELPLQTSEADTMFCMLVLHHIKDIEKVFIEIHRCLKKNGSLIVLDMVSHEHSEFFKMGHQHLGFSRQLFEEQSLFSLETYQQLPKSDRALGPQLFIAILHPNK
jgi:SAM-dependent methyltransferase